MSGVGVPWYRIRGNADRINNKSTKERKRTHVGRAVDEAKTFFVWPLYTAQSQRLVAQVLVRISRTRSGRRHCCTSDVAVATCVVRVHGNE